ncbi:MAG: large-conductance mechanosensitive channel protein MscL [Bacillota bacterium]|nr:large-conductance mechanosensitive channel protein MscL [Bacillota bacterium]
MAIIKEFKEFIMRGNVIDMAVGVVVGTAFKTIADSLVADIIMPPLGYLLAGVDFSHIRTVLQPATADSPEVAILWGNFLSAVLNFLVIAMVIFLVVKGINTMRSTLDRRLAAEAEAEAEAAEPAAPSEVELLQEILDELRAGR